MQRHIYDNNRCKTRAVKCPEVKKKILYNRKTRVFLFLRKTGAGAAAPQKNLSARTCVLERASCGAVILKMSKMHKFVLICKNASR